MNPSSARPSSAVRLVLYLWLAALAVFFYLVVSYLQNGAFGFPLDDAWIHQVYARNLGTHFEFAFFAGQPSAGSTSPLWAILLSLGYALHLDYRVWTTLLGIVFLAASAWGGGRVARHLGASARLAKWLVPAFLLFEWHMVWAAASGMEIVLFVFLSLLLVDLYLTSQSPLPTGAGGVHDSSLPWGEGLGVRAFAMGLVASLLTLTRPEGVVLAGLVGVGLTLQGFNVPTLQRFKTPALFAFTLLIVLAPYLAFNLQTSGTLLPNTFYAKAAEYAALTQSNFFARWLMLYRQPLIGAQVLLVPGLLFGMWQLACERQGVLLLPAAWILLLPALYAWRLPVEYQFGRYLMPIIPFVVVYGAAGTARLFRHMAGRILRRAWAMTLVALVAAFYLLGANFYAQSVAVIQCEMVAVANWTRGNLPPNALLAAHDIGAQEYFDPRPLLDMAGLVSPEVIPFIREEPKLLEWMHARGAQYAIFFPTWYPRLARDARLQEIFSTRCATTRAMGEENLRVYEIR
jgi:hypothetical protein